MKLAEEDKARDAAFSKALHKNSAVGRGGLLAMCSKDSEVHQAVVDEYFSHWDDTTTASDEVESARENRKTVYTTVTQQYYDLVTDIFEHFFGESFHFFRTLPGQPLSVASKEHERYLASKLNLQPGQKVLDVGCGIGGPAREIAQFTGANIVGLNNNDYQLERAIRYTANEHLQDQISYVKGDFMQMHFEPGTFDAAYAIEATSYAPSLQGVYTEIFKALKPGGTLAVYELIMTDNMDEDNSSHRQLRADLERGMGVPSLAKISDAIQALKASGFELKEAEDLACRANEIPWYYPFEARPFHLNSIWDTWRIHRMAVYHTKLVSMIVSLGERLGIFVPGTRKVKEQMDDICNNVTKGGKENLFTPIFIMVGQKPL